jgi:hypothetical protein
MYLNYANLHFFCIEFFLLIFYSFFTNTFQTIVYCYTSCTRQSIVEREGLELHERSEECSKGTSLTTCLVHRVLFFYFGFINLFFF